MVVIVIRRNIPSKENWEKRGFRTKLFSDNIASHPSSWAFLFVGENLGVSGQFEIYEYGSGSGEIMYEYILIYTIKVLSVYRLAFY